MFVEDTSYSIPENNLQEFGNRCTRTYSLGKHSGIRLFQHLFELIVSGGAASDLKLPLYPAFAPISVVGLRAVVFRHYFHELTRQCRVLCLSYPEIC